KLRCLLQDLGCRPDIPRHALLCHIKGADCKDIFGYIKKIPLHRKEDLILFPAPEYILIFKSTVESSSRHILDSVPGKEDSTKESIIVKNRQILIRYTDQLRSLIASR